MIIRTTPQEGPSKDAALTAFRPYVYRGTGADILTANAPGLGDSYSRRKSAREKKPTGKCPDCGYGRSGRNHRALCGGRP